MAVLCWDGLEWDGCGSHQRVLASQCGRSGVVCGPVSKDKFSLLSAAAWSSGSKGGREEGKEVVCGMWKLRCNFLEF